MKFFDILGICSVICCATIVTLDSPALGRMGRAAKIADADAFANVDFREGIAWYGLYFKDQRIGFSRIEQRRVKTDLEARSTIILKPVILGNRIEIEAQLDLRFDSNLKPRAFEMRLNTGTAVIEANGVINNGRLEYFLQAGGMSQKSVLEIGDATVELGLKSTFLHGKPTVGERRVLEVFDSLSLKNTEIVVEYLGLDTIEVLGESVDAHRIRRYINNLALDSWVNNLGEVLREEMPLGIVAIRETEAAATYGFGRGAHSPIPETLTAEDIRSLVFGVQEVFSRSRQTEDSP